MSDLIYFKKNVPYIIGVRADSLDRKGAVLSDTNPYYALRSENLRDFKMANKRLITQGLIIQTDEPSLDWDTSNAISDEKATELVKNFMGLKNELPKVSSVSVIEKLLFTADKLDRPIKTIKLIEARLAELRSDVEDDDFASKSEKAVRG